MNSGYCVHHCYAKCHNYNPERLITQMYLKNYFPIGKSEKCLKLCVILVSRWRFSYVYFAYRFATLLRSLVSWSTLVLCYFVNVTLMCFHYKKIKLKYIIYFLELECDAVYDT